MKRVDVKTFPIRPYAYFDVRCTRIKRRNPSMCIVLIYARALPLPSMSTTTKISYIDSECRYFRRLRISSGLPSSLRKRRNIQHAVIVPTPRRQRHGW